MKQLDLFVYFHCLSFGLLLVYLWLSNNIFSKIKFCLYLQCLIMWIIFSRKHQGIICVLLNCILPVNSLLYNNVISLK